MGLNPGSTKCCVLEQDTLLLVSTNEDLPRMLARVFGSIYIKKEFFPKIDKFHWLSISLLSF